MKMDHQKDLEVVIGTHLVHIDGDSLCVTTRGTLTLEDLKQLMEIQYRIKSTHGMIFALFDGRQGTGIDPDVRRYTVADRERYVADLYVAFGVPFALRIVINMMDRANALLGRKYSPLRSFDKEEDARRFFEEERARLRRTLASRKLG